MKQLHQNISGRVTSMVVGGLLAAIGTGTLSATEWQAVAGAQSADAGNQALAFLPNELWIHAGDSIQWTFPADEPHTVSFLTPGQVRPAAFSLVGVNGSVFIGCPGTTPDGSSFDGSTCLTSNVSMNNQTYTVNFPVAGNFKLVCLVHTRMTGAIHVLPQSETLPYDQSFYDAQGDAARRELLDDAAELEVQGMDASEQSPWHSVTAGISAILATGGGFETTSVMRFLEATRVVHVGDTVEWTNLATPVFHTITFGAEPENDMPPSSAVTLDADGVRHATISSTNDSLNSGFIGAPNQETVGQPQGPLDSTRFRVTSAAPGVFHYICALHDTLGMKGTIIVRAWNLR